MVASLRCDRRGTGGAGALEANDNAGFTNSLWIHASSSRKSAAVCQRLAGSFARHFFTVRSKAGGMSGCSVLIAGGLVVRIAARMLDALVPSNAFRPVVIS